MERQVGECCRRTRRRRNSTRNVLLLASTALLLGGLLTSTAIATGAEGSNRESAIAPFDPANFNNGEANATADTFAFNLVQGNANIGMSYGTSMAGYRDTTGSSEARALDLGVFPTLFGVQQCDGSPPILNPATFPPLSISNSGNPATAVPTVAEAFMPGFGSDSHGEFVGTQSATATPKPSSLAVTDSADADMLFVAMIGGRSEVSAELVDQTRQAQAVVTAKQLKVLGGIFTFEKPRWEAVAKSGRTSGTTGSFTFESATVLGIARSPEDAMADLAGFKIGLEEFLAPIGAKLELPAVTVDDNRVRVSPMSFKLVDPPFGAQSIAPFLANIRPIREAFNRQQLADDCKNETNLMLMDVLLGVLSGSGAIEIKAGGVDAWTDDTDFSSPPIEPIPPPSEIAPVEAVPPTPAVEGTSLDEYIPGDYVPGDYSAGLDDFDSNSIDEVDLSTDLPAPVEVAVKPTKKSADATEELAALPSANTSRLEDSTAGRAAVAVGVLGLLGALGLTFGERFRAHRTSRRIP